MKAQKHARFHVFSPLSASFHYIIHNGKGSINTVPCSRLSSLQRKSSGGSIFIKKIVPAHDLEGSKFFRGGPNFSFCSEISSGGSIFFEKFVPGGTNFGGSIFTVTAPPPLVCNHDPTASAIS